MARITHYQKCQCGAITLLFDNGASNSMYQDTFDALGVDISEAEQLPDSYCCNHCVNHWGIDLCECGSGERVGECSCGCNTPHDHYGVKFDSMAAIMNAFNNLISQ